MKYFKKYILISLISFVVIAIPINSVNVQKMEMALK